MKSYLKILAIFLFILLGIIPNCRAQTYVDYSTDEILVIDSIPYSANCKPRVYYSNGKNQPIELISSVSYIDSFKIVEGTEVYDSEAPTLDCYFPNQKKEIYKLRFRNLYSCGSYLECINPDLKVQGFSMLSGDKKPLVSHGSIIENSKDSTLFLGGDSTHTELIYFEKTGKKWRVYYQKGSNKFIELKIINRNKLNDSYQVKIPNDDKFYQNSIITLKLSTFTMLPFYCLMLKSSNSSEVKSFWRLIPGYMDNSYTYDKVKQMISTMPR